MAENDEEVEKTEEEDKNYFDPWEADARELEKEDSPEYQD